MPSTRCLEPEAPNPQFLVFLRGGGGARVANFKEAKISRAFFNPTSPDLGSTEHIIPKGGFRVQGLGFRILGLWGSGFRVLLTPCRCTQTANQKGSFKPQTLNSILNLQLAKPRATGATESPTKNNLWGEIETRTQRARVFFLPKSTSE